MNNSKIYLFFSSGTNTTLQHHFYLTLWLTTFILMLLKTKEIGKTINSWPISGCLGLKDLCVSL